MKQIFTHRATNAIRMAQFPQYWETEIITTAATTGTHTIVVTTTDPEETGDYTLDWTIGEEEGQTCESDC